MPLDSYVAAEILATCNALGCEIRGTYEKSSDCLTCLKDLILYLRRDDDDHSVLRQLGELNLVQTDLLPILKHYPKHKEIFDMTLRLLVILTNPAFLLYKEEIPEEKTALNVYLSLISYLHNYKQAFTDAKVWIILYNSLKDLLSVNYGDREEDDRLTIERILIIARNILHVPPSEADEKRTDDDASLHDQVIWALHLSHMEDLILYLSQNEDEHEYCLHVLEIISLMLREQMPEVLVAAGRERVEKEKEQDEKRLVSVRQKELDKRLEREKKLSGHRFNGVYYVRNMKSISDREYISHKLLKSLNTLKFDEDKTSKLTPKNRRPVSDVNVSRRSTLSICLFLKEFCSEIASNSYNVLMASVKRSLANRRSEDHDDTYYLWAMQYFMEFNRRNNFQLDAISETISVHTFHYIQTQIETYYDMLRSDKKKVKYWSRRMHLGLKAYKELLETLRVMSLSTESSVKTCSDVIKSNVFYVIEYRELLLTLFTNYNEVWFSMSYLVDLVQTTHLFLKLLEQYGKGCSQLIVQKKKRKRRRTKKKKLQKSQDEEQVEGNEIHQNWFDITSDLSAIIQGRKPLPSNIFPFDAASALSFEEQKTEIVFKIREAMKRKEAGQAVALLRAARDLWPEGNAFGSPDIEPEEEFLILREIFLADLPTEAPKGIDEVESEEIEEFEECTTSEQQLNLTDFFNRFASIKVVRPCCHLLANYKRNSVSTNSSLLKLLHRIAWDCKMHALFFQASVFLNFQAILHDPDVKYEPIIKELARFAKFILSKFFEVANVNKKVFLEMLFWKGPREAYELEEGYGSYMGMSSSKSKKKAHKFTGENSEDMDVVPVDSFQQEEPSEDMDLLEQAPSNSFQQEPIEDMSLLEQAPVNSFLQEEPIEHVDLLEQAPLSSHLQEGPVDSMHLLEPHVEPHTLAKLSQGESLLQQFPVSSSAAYGIF